MLLPPLPLAVRSGAAALLLLFGVVIVWASLQPSLSPPGQFGLDKLIHLLAFAGMAGLSTLAAGNRRQVILLIVLLGLVGAGIEVAQSLIPGREGGVGDFLSDCAGILLGIATALALRRRAAAVAPRHLGRQR